MNRLTVISHIFNEEYLLPFWLEHHSKIFDHGIILDYCSTDNSLNIIKTLCPTWTILQTRNIDMNGKPTFNAALVDEEVQDIEKTIEGFKIALNTTEFFMIHTSKEEFVNSLEKQWIYSGKSYSVVHPSITNPVSLDEFMNGMTHMYTYKYNRGTRFLHAYTNLVYTCGRHHHLCDSSKNKEGSYDIRWIGFYPWNENTIQRKLKIQDNIPESDKHNGYGIQHITNESLLNSEYQFYVSSCTALKDLYT